MKHILNYNLLEAKKPANPDLVAADIPDAESEDFDKKAWSKIQVAMIFIAAKYGFFASLLTRLNIKQAPKSLYYKIKTMGTDGISIYYNPNFVHELTPNQVVFVLCHEVMHCAYRHMFREKALASLDHTRWNEAGDYAINIMLFDPTQANKLTNGSGVELDKCVGAPLPCMLWDKQFEGMSAELIYKKLGEGVVGGYWTDDKTKCGGGKGGDGEGDGQGGGGGKGSGKGGKGKGKGGTDGTPGPGGDGDGTPGPGSGPGQGSRTGTMDETFDPGELKGGIGGRDAEKPFDPSDKKKMEQEWKNTDNKAKTRGGGKAPAIFARMLKDLNKAQLNWKAILKKYLKEILNKTIDKPWTRRFIDIEADTVGGDTSENLRSHIYKHLKEMYIPGEKDDYGKIRRLVVGIDTSGSISDDDLAVFASEIKGILTEYNVKSIDIINCDADVHDPQHFNEPKAMIMKKYRPKGGVGTSFDPVFKWIETHMIKNGQTPDVTIYFTDGYPVIGTGPGGWPSPKKWKIKSYERSIIWVIVNDRTKNTKVPFGRRLDVDTQNM